MAEQGQRGRAGVPGPAPDDVLQPGEQPLLTHALETRFADHLEAAAAAVRQAEQELADAQDRLTQARQASEGGRYRSDPLVFMRESVAEEVESLTRKTTGKKARASYRFLLDRAVELAAGEVQGFDDDRIAAQQEHESGLEACRVAEQRATEALTAAREMQDRVWAAEQSAREGLAILVEKLTRPEERGGP